MESLFKIYKQGEEKSYQRDGNDNNLATFIQLGESDYIPQVVTKYYDFDETLEITSIRLYRYTITECITSYSYPQLISHRTLDQTISAFGSIANVMPSDSSKIRFVFNRVRFNNPINDGYIYELVIATNQGDFESELFSTFESYATIALFQCSNASISNVDFGVDPVFTIDVEELNNIAGDATMDIKWLVPSIPTFGNLYFPFKFGGAKEVEDSETKSFVGGDTKTYTFTYSDYLAPGDYSIQYQADFGSCSGTLSFTVASYFSMDVGNSGWDIAGATGLDENKVIDFELTVDNSYTSAKLCTVQFNWNGVINEFTESVPAGGSYVFTKQYTVNRYIDNNMSVTGDAGARDFLLAAIPPIP